MRLGQPDPRPLKVAPAAVPNGADEDAMRAAIAERADWIRARVIGRDQVIEAVFIALLTRGHVLLEGPPGLAKTRIAQLFAETVEGVFRRIQFTPDLLPGDLTGAEILEPETHALVFRRGPIFCNVLLADEINRAPAKVQSALLEAMEECQVTAGDTTHTLDRPFIVLATQNPIEHEGTWDLPQAQFDRFMLRVVIDYPFATDERAILDLSLSEAAQDGDLRASAPPPLGARALATAQKHIAAVHVSDIVRDYAVRLVDATRRQSELCPEVARQLSHAVSPRGTIMLARGAQARAWLNGRDHVLPADIAALAPSVLAHRMGLTPRAEADGVAPEALVTRLLEVVDVV